LRRLIEHIVANLGQHDSVERSTLQRGEREATIYKLQLKLRREGLALHLALVPGDEQRPSLAVLTNSPIVLESVLKADRGTAEVPTLASQPAYVEARKQLDPAA
jgi:hypothetical protein